MKNRLAGVVCVVVAIILGAGSVISQQEPAGAKGKAKTPKANPVKKKPLKKKGNPRLLAALPLANSPLALAQSGHQLDFPALAQDSDGKMYVVYVDHDGTVDQLRLARKTEHGLVPVASIGAPGVIHDPAITMDQEGNAWCFWGKLNEKGVIDLKGCVVRSGESPGGIFTVSATGSPETFAATGVDSNGKIWVTWQSMRNTRPDIFTKFCNPRTGEWSPEIRVSESPEGDWEPKISFDQSGNSWIVYDGARGNEFNLFLAKVQPDGGVKTWPVAHSPQYEARASIAPARDGGGFWIAAERGKVRWGLDTRGHGNATGINARKSILFGRFTIDTEEFETIPLGHAGQAGAPVNLPAIGVAPDGTPWVSYRYFERVLWRIAMTHYDLETKQWSSRRRLDGGTFGQDRDSYFVTGKGGKLWYGWSSDLRNTKASKEAGVYLAEIDPDVDLPAATPGGKEVGENLTEPFAPSQNTPEREFSNRHTWKVEDTEYGLYWGDVHRHTDVSNCRTGFDGCINEHFRYAYDIAKLDFMGTSDHTDIGKIYSPYEWWHNQKMHDVFHTPGRFNSVYVYEREQRWPWGHRNVVFAERGGPVVYIQRTRYRNSRWQKEFPVDPGIGEITPYELWDVLKRTGKRVAVVSHTGATGMGTDWGRYDTFDYDIETVLEIFQGARVSYEAEGAPQPTAGLRPGEKYTINGDAKSPPPPPAPIETFGKFKPGTYQNALQLGRQLGVFTSSDHISSHVSYGGVFCKDFTREGIIEGLLARRTIAATDKIYLNFTCNGQQLGSIFSTGEKPELWFKVDGTAKLKRVTIVRNEGNWKVFDTIDSNKFEATVTDDDPAEGENRYYIRVEQEDGNMAWSSPVWVEVK